MAKKKKSRKVGQIGIPKSIEKSGNSKFRSNNQKPKNRKGHKAGSRQHVSENDDKTKKIHQKTDPRIGSKQLISLEKYKNPSKVKVDNELPLDSKRYFSPMEELEDIENNKVLERLLLKQEKTELTEQESEFVEKLTSRYAHLCEMLGIATDDSEVDDDPYSKLDAIKLDDYKD